MATSGVVSIRRVELAKLGVVLDLFKRLEVRTRASYSARGVEELAVPVASPIAKMFLAEVVKNLSTMMPVRLYLTPAFSRPRSRDGSLPVARAIVSVRTIFSWPASVKMTILEVWSCSRATRRALVITMTPRSLTRWSVTTEEASLSSRGRRRELRSKIMVLTPSSA